MGRKSKGAGGGAPESPAEKDTFEAVCAKIQENSRRQLEKMKSILDEENTEVDTLEEAEAVEEQSILENFKRNCPEGDGGSIDNLMSNLLAGGLTCLICIDNIRHTEPIWSCSSCYQILHLNCVNKWAKDSLFEAPKPGEQATSKKFWSCPNCRSEHKVIPSDYLCFCGKERDPKFDKWLCPHSCGSLCGRSLNPLCGHNCALPCHPGQCAPCPKTVQAFCHCSRGKTVRRCTRKEWSCNSPCGRNLICGVHKCESLCHSGTCPPCSIVTRSSCNCLSETKDVKCAEKNWRCKAPCGRKLSCGKHTCDGVCHKETDCDACPNSGQRSCPCGKENFPDLDCSTEKVPTCVNTCEKILACKIHTCWQKCHRGECMECSETVSKKCKCGSKTRPWPCAKDFVCDTKCGRQKPCGHLCTRKCCPPDGECPPCTIVCNKKLQCGNHKCKSLCHMGPCYPCREQRNKVCFCGKTTASFPCGTVLKNAKVVCREICEAPPNCHHETQVKHSCHDGHCPPCRLPCGKKLPCSHICSAKCHSAVMTKVVPKEKPRGPWEPQPQEYWTQIEKKCPKCTVPTEVDCLGGHGKTTWPCHVAEVRSCGRQCGRTLPCTNHVCAKECHTVSGSADNNLCGDTCEENCGQGCVTKGRHENCPHPCGRSCHPGNCSPCNQYMKLRCYCGYKAVVKPCAEWCRLTEEEREASKTCDQRCSKELSCGHRCFFKCHDGDCADASLCKKKVTINCPCKRLREEFECEGKKARHHKVKCDETCKNLKKQKMDAEKARKKEEEEAKKRIEDEMNAREVQRALGDRRKRPGRRREFEEEEDVPMTPRALKLIAFGSILAIFSGWLLQRISYQLLFG